MIESLVQSASCSVASMIRLFSFVPLAMMVSSSTSGSQGSEPWLTGGKEQVGTDMVFHWRTLMSLVLVLDADCFLEKAGLVGAVGSISSIFLGIFIITKSLSNLLLW